MHKHDDNLWSQLSQEWLVKEKTMPDMVLLKRRMLIHQLKMIGLIFLDLLITVAVLYMFYRAYTDDLSISFKVWLALVYFLLLSPPLLEQNSDLTDGV